METKIITETNKILPEYIRAIFEEVKINIRPLYHYKQGNCHNLAHFISLILNSYGVPHRKIWIYSPSRYLKKSTKSIVINDINQLSPTGKICWGYHVAPIIFVDGQEYVFDFFLNENQPLSISEWKSALNSKNYFVDLKKPSFYLFFTENQKNNRKLFNGNYFEYNNICKAENWLPAGLAINHTAWQFAQNEAPILNQKSSLAADYRLLVGSITNFETVFKNNSTNTQISKDFLAKHKDIILKYKEFYIQNLEFYTEKINRYI